MSMPSGSFQQLTEADYYKRSGEKQQRQFFEKTFGGSMKPKKKMSTKLSKKSKKNSVVDTPIICALPT